MPMSVMLLVLRLFFGALLMWHGINKISNFEALVVSYPNPVGLGSRVSLYLTIFAEVFCSVGVIFGAFYRLALMPIIFSMGVALLVVHHGQPFAAKEPSLIYLVVFGLIFITGAGCYSLDNIIATLLHRESVADSGNGERDAATAHRRGSELPTDDVPHQ